MHHTRIVVVFPSSLPLVSLCLVVDLQNTMIWGDAILESGRPLYRPRDVVKAVDSTFTDPSAQQLFVSGCFFFAPAALLSLARGSMLTIMGIIMIFYSLFKQGVRPAWGIFLMVYLVAITLRSPGGSSRRVRQAQQLDAIRRMRAQEKRGEAEREKKREVEEARRVLAGVVEEVKEITTKKNE